MKKRLVSVITIALLVLFYLIRITGGKTILPISLPDNCSNANFQQIWESILKEPYTGIITKAVNLDVTGVYCRTEAVKYIEGGNDTFVYFSLVRDISNWYRLDYGYYIIFDWDGFTFNNSEYSSYWGNAFDYIFINKSRTINGRTEIADTSEKAREEFQKYFKLNITNYQIVSESIYFKLNYTEDAQNHAESTIFKGLNKNDVLLFIKNNTSCTPNWTAYNTTCASDDRLVEYFTDSNSCNQAPPANLTFHCDSDINGIIGNLTSLDSRTNLNLYINSSAANLSLNYAGKLNNKIEFKSGSEVIVEFYWNFTSPLDLDNIYIEKQGSPAPRGYLLIKGISANKKVLVDKLTNSTRICVKNAAISSIGDLSSACEDTNELKIDCPATVSNISCSITGNFFQVQGLTNSAIKELAVNTTTICTSNWNCTNFSVCADSLKSRSCNDLNHCNSSMLNKTDTQACVSAPTCTPNWNCTNWTSCSKSGNQTRICNDKNVCNSTNDNKKTETDDCEYKESSVILWIIISIIAVIIVVVIILIVYFLNKKPEEQIQTTQPKSPVTQYGYSSQQGNQGVNNSGM